MSPQPDANPGGTRVVLPDLIALRARAGKPVLHATHVDAAMAGGHQSKLRGRGMDYAESRIYQRGDDVRCIDWRRTARSGRWHTKLFQEERAQQMLVLLDTNATMRFGTRVRFKSVAAARAAAWWAWTGVRAGDRIGAATFGVVRDATSPHAQSRGALGVLGALARWDEQARESPGDIAPGESLAVALRRMHPLLAPGTRVLLLSDGWCVDDRARAAMTRAAARVDLRVGIVMDALECEPAAAGIYNFEADGRGTTADLTSAAARARFRDQLGDGRRRMTALCDALGIAWCPLVASCDPDLPLTQLWRPPRVRR